MARAHSSGYRAFLLEQMKLPYKSASQQRWAHTPAGKKALGGTGAVSEWDRASKDKKLPIRVSKAVKGKY